jgi:hypothetical protein
MSQKVSDEEDNERSLVEGLDPSAPITVALLTRLLKEQEDSLIQKLEEKLEEKLEPINRKLDHLVAASPHAAMTIEQNQNVLVGTTGEYTQDMARAIEYGGTATWTYMRIATDTTIPDVCLAVSCEHYALAYQIANRKIRNHFRFVSLPLELIRCGILWVGLSKGHKYGPGASRSDSSDITIVMLVDFPDDIIPENVPVWPKQLSNNDFPVSQMVSGWSPTGTVHGSHCALVSDRLVFVESSGEAGNSGTLMYLLRPGETLLIGVYLGTTTHERGADIKWRGRICRFPERLQDSFLKHVQPPSSEARNRLKIQTGPWRRGLRHCTVFKELDAQGNEYYRGRVGEGRSEYGILVGASGSRLLDEEGGLA